MANEAWSFFLIAASKTATGCTEEITVRRHNLPALAAAPVVGFAGSEAARRSLEPKNPEPKGKVLTTPTDASKEKHGVPVGRASAGDMPIQPDRDLGTLCGC